MEGIMTRAQKRQRSQSKEPQGAPPTANGSKAPKDARTNGHNLEAVAEELPRGSASQKSIRTESSMSLGRNDSPTQSQTSNGGGRPQSPLSLSRAQEKNELQSLNDRLAVVLSKLSDSQEENRELKIQIETVEEEATRDLHGQLERYKEELEKARIALDAENKEKVIQVLAREKLELELHDYQKQAGKDSKRITEAENRAKAAEKLVRDHKQEIEENHAAISDLDNEIKVLKGDLSDLKKQLHEAQKELERETIERADTENRLRTALEKAQLEASIADDRHQRRSMKIADSVDSSSVTRRSAHSDITDYMDSFRQELEDARRDIEDQMESKYAKQVDGLEKMVHRQREDIEMMKRSQESSRKDHKEDQKTVALLQKRNRELEDEIGRQRVKFENDTDRHLERIANLNEQNIDLSNRYQALLEEFRKLQSTNVGLAQELATYNTLLSSEEERLGITSPDQVRPLKRKRIETPVPYNTPIRSLSKVHQKFTKTTENKSKASGPVRILEVVPGKVIRIENTSNNTVSLGNWHLKQDDIVYDFQPDHVINGHSIISVYSSTENERAHDGITEIVWTQPWAEMESVKTILTNSDQVEVASYETEINSPASQQKSPGLLKYFFG